MIAFGSEELFKQDFDENQVKWDYNTPEIQFSSEKLDQLLENAFSEQDKINKKITQKVV